MAPKKKAAQADKGRIEDEVEEPLQAVVRYPRPICFTGTD